MGSRSSKPHFRDAETEAPTGEVPPQGACCTPEVMEQDSRHTFRACSPSPVPIPLWEHWKWAWLCPLQGWLGGAVWWVLGKVQTQVPLSLYGVGHALLGSGGCMIELSIYYHSLGTILSPEEGAPFLTQRHCEGWQWGCGSSFSVRTPVCGHGAGGHAGACGDISHRWGETVRRTGWLRHPGTFPKFCLRAQGKRAPGTEVTAGQQGRAPWAGGTSAPVTCGV